MRLLWPVVIIGGCKLGGGPEFGESVVQQPADCTQRVKGTDIEPQDGLDHFGWLDNTGTWQVTTDGGGTSVATDPPAVEIAEGIVLGLRSGVLHRSEDGGTSFTEVTGAPANITRIERTATAAFVVTEARRLFRSTDDGLTWSLIPIPQIAHLGFGDDSFYGWGQYANNGWQETSDELLRSTDDGESWDDALPRWDDGFGLSQPLPWDRGVAVGDGGAVAWIPNGGYPTGNGLCAENGVVWSIDHGDEWWFTNPIGRCGAWFSELAWSSDGRLWAALPFDGYNEWMRSGPGGLLGWSDDYGLTWTWIDPVAGTYSGMPDDPSTGMTPRELHPLPNGQLVFAFGGDQGGGNAGEVAGWCITGGDEAGTMTLPD